MVPAYRGDLGPITACAEDIVAAGDDIETSIYVGFAAYMAAMTGRLDDADRWITAQRQMVGRRHVHFAVDTVGNGYAAAIHVHAARAELLAATELASAPMPADPAFSMTAAAALTQVSVLTCAPDLLALAASWARQGTIPLLQYLPTAIELATAHLGGERQRAADLADRYWEEAVAVPVSRVNWLSLHDVALLGAGRTTTVAAHLAEADALVDRMVDAPFCVAAVHQGRARLALATGDLDTALAATRQLLDVATGHRFATLVVDAVELAAVAIDRQGRAEPAALLVLSARRRRLATGHRWLALAPGQGYDELLARATSAGLRAEPDFDDAVTLARRHLPPPAVPGRPEL
jgi:hypothetical protein